MTHHVERCKNPWDSECKNSDVELYIYYKGNRRPVCRDCWERIADEDIEW